MALRSKNPPGQVPARRKLLSAQRHRPRAVELRWAEEVEALGAQNNIGADGTDLAGIAVGRGGRNLCLLVVGIWGTCTSVDVEPSRFSTSSMEIGRAHV